SDVCSSDLTRSQARASLPPPETCRWKNDDSTVSTNALVRGALVERLCRSAAVRAAHATRSFGASRNGRNPTWLSADDGRAAATIAAARASRAGAQSGVARPGRPSAGSAGLEELRRRRRLDRARAPNRARQRAAVDRAREGSRGRGQLRPSREPRAQGDLALHTRAPRSGTR